MKYKNDILLIGILLIFPLAFLSAVLFQKKTDTNELLIYGGGTLLSSLSAEQELFLLLKTDGATYEIERFQSEKEALQSAGAAEHYNLIAVEQGSVFVREADCKGKDCVRQRKISKNGETIICLPHKMVLCMENADESRQDAVTW